ncbi:unnamed protein product [Mytilus edulis]|uniref:Endonuclease/exonuclease/phosphatase domain-containing protein n=1 Tax=Mytilus edulis TaxID=6550 RepID=A0A8S3RLF4_MYTED|nr:unnamed protein product [Mytilus edulis]
MSTIPSIDSSFSPSVFSSPKPRILSSTTEESPSRASKSKSISGLEHKQQNLRILMINCQSIRNKRSELNESVEYIKPDVIIGCESWLANDHRTAEIFPNGYNKNVFRKDRNKNGGGVFIAVHDKFTTSAVENSENDCELQWAEIQTKTKSVIIGSYYRPPNASIDALHNLKTSVLNVSENSKDKPIILAGDFNLPHIDWNNNTVKSGKPQVKHHQELLEFIEEFGMEQLQLKPSRENNILDLFLTNHPSLVKSCNTLPGISDHNMLVLDTDLKPQYNKPKSREIYVYKKANWEEIKADVIKFGADIINSNTSVEDKWTNLKNGIETTLKLNVPRKITNKRHNLPWLSNSVKKKIRRKHKLFQKAKHTGKPDDWTKFKQHKRATQKAVRQAHWQYVNTILDAALAEENKIVLQCKTPHVAVKLPLIRCLEMTKGEGCERGITLY